MELNKLLQELDTLQRKMAAYRHAMGLIMYDGQTIAPKGSADNRGHTLGIFSETSYVLATGDETGKLLAALKARENELSSSQKRQVEELYRTYEHTKKIPMNEYVEYQVLLNKAETVWREAKEKNDFKLFEPHLEKIFETNRKFAAYLDSSKPAYDVLLDDYERGLTMADCDKFFSTLRERLVPLISAIKEKGEQPDTSFLEKKYPIDKQKKLADFVTAIMKIDPNHCCIAETEHPFTTSFSKDDVRITTHYYETNPLSALYSTIHEGGHALYELGIGNDLRYTCLEGGVSMGIHESQSRFYENIIGRSRGFAELIFPKLKELFPEQLDGISADDLYRAVNKGEPSLIRIEADELTYCLHIMVRYELESQLMDGRLKVSELPAAWNAKYKEYLGLDVPSDTQGVLQDTHWASGLIGYFPSYALGSAYGVQMLAKMRESVDFDAAVASGDLTSVNSWLESRVWQKGGLYDPGTLLEQCCEAPFDPAYYTDYLIKKYSELYGLQTSL